MSNAAPLWEQPVDARLLAMDVNDNACFLNERAALESIVGTPPGAIERRPAAPTLNL